MVEIISVRFKSGGKEYYFNPNGVQFQEGDGVIVETTRGTEYAQCVRENNMIDEIELTAPLSAPVLAGTVVGQAVFTLDGKEVGRVDLLCGKTVLPRLESAMDTLKTGLPE